MHCYFQGPLPLQQKLTKIATGRGECQVMREMIAEPRPSVSKVGDGCGLEKTGRDYVSQTPKIQSQHTIAPLMSAIQFR